VKAPVEPKPSVTGDTLQAETERLTRSWTRYDAAMLRDYLVSDVEDPRLNVQSVLGRHFLVEALFGQSYGPLAAHELQFAAVMNWLLQLSKGSPGPDQLLAVRHALAAGADNAEGDPIPGFVTQTFRSLPARAGEIEVPNYLEAVLNAGANECPRLAWPPLELDTFQHLWSRALANESPRDVRVLEPACGSANDYRCLAGCGIARLVRYTGFDLCEKNVLNARALFPDACFRVGNVFAIDAPDRSFDLCVVHDLFEHLSPEGLERAADEICRVTKTSLCLGFFNMAAIPDHLVRPTDEYHWNTLSLQQTRDLFARRGFQGRAIRVPDLLRWRARCDQTHNPNACILILHAQPSDPARK
jgi:hypothetical protein